MTEQARIPIQERPHTHECSDCGKDWPCDPRPGRCREHHRFPCPACRAFPHAEVAITASPCADCGCGSLCHWDDLRTPPHKATAAEWALLAGRVPCQRCPKCKKGYRIQPEQEPPTVAVLFRRIWDVTRRSKWMRFSLEFARGEWKAVFFHEKGTIYGKGSGSTPFAAIEGACDQAMKATEHLSE